MADHVRPQRAGNGQSGTPREWQRNGARDAQVRALRPARDQRSAYDHGPAYERGSAYDRSPAHDRGAGYDTGPLYDTGPAPEGPGPLRVAWRDRWLLAAAAAVVGVVTLIGASLLPEVYRAETTLAFPTSGTAIGLRGGDAERTRALRTEAAQITSLGLVEEAAAQLDGGADAEELVEQVDADPSPDADLITVRATADTAARSAAIANLVAETYLERLSTRLQGRVDRLEDEAEALAERASEQQDQLNSLVEDAGDESDEDPAVAAARLRLEATLSQQIETQQLLDEARAENANGSSVQILMPANEPGAPLRPQPVRYAATAVLLTVLGLLTLRWWRAEPVAPVLERAEQAEDLLGVASLAVVPHVEGSAAGGVVTDGSGVATAGFRMIAAVAGAQGSILVTAPGEDEPCSALVRNLAAALADDGWLALLVEGGPGDAQRAPVDVDPGLGDLLTGAASVGDCIVAGDIDAELRIGLMPWGSHSADVLRHARANVRWALDRCTSIADIVLVDGPSLLSSPDAVIWATNVDTVLPVVTIGTPLADIHRLGRRLEQLGRPAAGLIVREPAQRQGRRGRLRTQPIRWSRPVAAPRIEP